MAEFKDTTNTLNSENSENINQKHKLIKDQNELIVLNLKMLSLIKPGDKLYLENDLIKIDHPTLTQGLYRWLNDYSQNHITGLIEQQILLMN